MLNGTRRFDDSQAVAGSHLVTGSYPGPPRPLAFLGSLGGGARRQPCRSTRQWTEQPVKDTTQQAGPKRHRQRLTQRVCWIAGPQPPGVLVRLNGGTAIPDCDYFPWESSGSQPHHVGHGKGSGAVELYEWPDHPRHPTRVLSFMAC